MVDDGPLRTLLWLCVTVAAHVLTSLLAVLCRWLQLRPVPAIPPLRLALLVNLLGLAALLGGHGAVLSGSWLLRLWVRSRQRKLDAKAHTEAAAAAAGQARLDVATAAAGSDPGTLAATGSTQQLLALSAAASAEPAPPVLPSAAPRLQPPRPDVPLVRGLSTKVWQLERRRPRLVRGAALAVLSGSYAVGAACQVAAAGLVDASVVQLVLSFTVVGVALVQRLLLRLSLPLALYPCAAAMLAGAAMILVPTLGKGAAGGLEGAGWLGFGLAVVTLLMTCVNFITLQASSGLGFTSLGLQLYFLGLSALVLLPLSLGIDGTDWSAQFGGWVARDWGVLVATSTAVYLGANAALQNATWQLGASTVALFFGVRLVAAVVEQRLILGRTVVSTPLQIAGVCLTVASVTAYTFLRWQRSRRRGASSGGGATGGGTGGSGGGAGGSAG